MAVTEPQRTPGTVLVVDDEQYNCELLAEVLSRDGFNVRTAPDGKTALAAIDLSPPDLVLLDIMMPELDGFQVCSRIKQTEATRLLPVVLLTGLHDRVIRLRGIEAGADDFISKPFDIEELKARIRSLVRLKRYTDDLESAESVIVGLALTIEARDPCTNGHCERLARYAAAIGSRLDLDPEQAAALARGAFLHDIGKIAIPDAILLKPTPLTAAEYEIVKQHPLVGDRLCGQLRSLRLVRQIVRHHHERLDGSGYPDGLRGDEIPLLAQIVSIVDTFDAVTTARPYRPARTADVGFEELRSDGARGRIRADLVEVFADVASTLAANAVAPKP